MLFAIFVFKIRNALISLGLVVVVVVVLREPMESEKCFLSVLCVLASTQRIETRSRKQCEKCTHKSLECCEGSKMLYIADF